MYATFLNIWHVQKAKTEAYSKSLLQRRIKLSQNTVALDTSLWQSSPRGRQCLCCTAGLESSFKAASPFSQHRPSHNTSNPKVLTLQVHLSESDQLSTRGRGLDATPEELTWSKVCTRQRTATSNHLPPRQEYSNWSSPGPREGFSTCHPHSIAKYRKVQRGCGSAQQSSSTLPPKSISLPTGCLQPWLSQQGRKRKAAWNKDATMTIDSRQQKQWQRYKVQQYFRLSSSSFPIG